LSSEALPVCQPLTPARTADAADCGLRSLLSLASGDSQFYDKFNVRHAISILLK
jgi:hypothetical protein